MSSHLNKFWYFHCALIDNPVSLYVDKFLEPNNKIALYFVGLCYFFNGFLVDFFWVTTPAVQLPPLLATLVMGSNKNVVL